MPSPSSASPLRRGWYLSRRQLFTVRKLTLFSDALHITSWHFLRRDEEVIPLSAIERADLVPHHSRKGTLLRLRFQDGTRRSFSVPKQGLWKQDINNLTNAPFHNPSCQSIG